MAKTKAKTKAIIRPGMEPTPEQMARGRYEVADVVDKRPGGGSIIIGKAFKRRPTFEVLGDRGVFSDAELKALRHYRHHADIADRSPLRDSLNKSPGGNGTGPTIETLNAIRVRDDCERAAGSLRDILHAVVVNDVTLSEWAIAKAGAIEECEMRRGKRVCRMKARNKPLAIAKLEIQMAAKRVEAELSA